MSQRRVEVLTFPNVQLLDVAGPVEEVFHAAIGQAARGRAPAPYTIKIIAPEGTRISATAGLAFATEPLPDVTEPVDTLSIAGGQGVMQAAANIDIVDWLRARFAVAGRTASVCTGAFLLSAAGLLDVRRAGG
jgi:transcriptional regulator GlxA family with amidase domain